MKVKSNAGSRISGKKHFKEEELILSPNGGKKCDKLKDKWTLAPWRLFKKIVESVTADPKLRWDLLPFEPLLELVKVMTYGAEKYEPNNWQKVEIKRYFDAWFRHFYDLFVEENPSDNESNFLHSSHMLANSAFISYLDMDEKKNGKNS